LFVVDVKPIASLINLDVLDLSSNVIVDAGALKDLPELVELKLSKDSIVVMKGFTYRRLKRLILDTKLIASVQNLGEPPELRMLSLANMLSFLNSSDRFRVMRLLISRTKARHAAGWRKTVALISP